MIFTCNVCYSSSFSYDDSETVCHGCKTYEPMFRRLILDEVVEAWKQDPLKHHYGRDSVYENVIEIIKGNVLE